MIFNSYTKILEWICTLKNQEVLMATPTTPYRFNPTRVIIEVNDDIPPPDSAEAEDQGVEVDVNEILNEQPVEAQAKEPEMTTQTTAPAAPNNGTQIGRCAAGPSSNDAAATPAAPDANAAATVHVVPAPQVKKGMGIKTVIAIVLVAVVMTATIMWLLLGSEPSRRVPPPTIVDGESRVVITPATVDDGTTKPVADMGSTTLPPRTPAAVAPSLNPRPTIPAAANAPAAAASTASAPGQIHTYKVQTGDYVLAIMKVCDEDQDEADAINWFEENNDDVTDTDALAINQVVKVPCQIKQGKKNAVWQMRQKIARQRKAAEAKNQPVKPVVPPATPPVVTPAASPPASTAPAAPATKPPTTDGGVPAAAK